MTIQIHNNTPLSVIAGLLRYVRANCDDLPDVDAAQRRRDIRRLFPPPDSPRYRRRKKISADGSTVIFTRRRRRAIRLAPPAGYGLIEFPDPMSASEAYGVLCSSGLRLDQRDNNLFFKFEDRDALMGRVAKNYNNDGRINTQ